MRRIFPGSERCRALELAQALKIVSDNADEPMDGVKPALVSRLVQQNLPVIEETAEQLLALSKLLQDLNNPDPDYHAITRQPAFYRQPATPVASHPEEMARRATWRQEPG